MPREKGFENKRVVIIGGSSGIGLAVAEESASQGADVVIVSSKVERVQEAIKSIGGDVRGEAVDVSDEKAVESFFTNIGTFDHLVFTAGDSQQ
jgi:NAD(P)-dependent dehydrogenase (short-subunit alcohol dehydrogenase family)